MCFLSPTDSSSSISGSSDCCFCFNVRNVVVAWEYIVTRMCCSHRPVVTLEHYNIIMYSLGGAHCFFSFLVLVTYFLSNHPTLPSISSIVQRIRYYYHHLLLLLVIINVVQQHKHGSFSNKH